MKTILLLLGFLAGTFVSLAQPIFILSPFENADTSSFAPFLTDQTQASSVRFQQVYGASDFTGIGSPMWITELRFASTLSFIDFNLPDVRIDFSTTARVPDGLSSIFAENVGTDNTVVLAGPLHFFDSTAGGIRIPLQTPFLYDPSRGNLLMDVRNFLTIPRRPLNDPAVIAVGILNDTVSLAVAFDVDSPKALLATGGLSTGFNVIPVPEPSTVSLLILGLGAFGFAAWKRCGVRQAEQRDGSIKSRQGRASHVTD